MRAISLKDLEKQWEEEELFKKKHPYKALWRKIKWYCTGYWKKAFLEFLSTFHAYPDRPFYAFWMYIYTENVIFAFFYDKYGAIKSFFRKVIKLYDWSKVLWNNYDWDHGYIWPILQKKFERMERSLANGNHLNCSCDAAELQYVVLKFAKIQTFGWQDCPYEAEAKTLVSNPNDYLEVDIKAHELHEEDMKRVFIYIAENHRKWWD